MEVPNTISKRLLWIFRTAPIHFFVLQVFEAFSTILEHLLEKEFQHQPILGAVLFFPVFCIASTLGNALTFASILDLVRGTKPTFQRSFHKVKTHLSALVVSSLILGVVFILGFCALILPAFYFMAIYLFVPHLILTEEKTSLSIYLFRSTKLGKSALWKCISLVSFSIVLGLLVYLVGQSIGTLAGGIASIEWMRQFIHIGLNVFLSMCSAMLIDILASLLFLELKGKHR